MKKTILIISCTLVLLLATACASSEASAFPTGKFIKSGMTDYGMLFNPDGTFSVFEGEITYVQGTYEVDGGVFTETSNDGGCDTNVSFTYSFDGSDLTFNYVGNPEDDKACSGRYSDFNGVTYTLVEGSFQPGPEALPEIKIDASDYQYTALETVTAGWVRVILTNNGAEPHHVQFLLLNEGVSAEQFEEALMQAEGPALAMTKQVGGVGAVHPGGTASAVINLEAGEYVILCLIPSPDDLVAHHAKGMIKSLTVEEGVSSASAPKADLTVNMKDFIFEMPVSLPAGKITIQVTNGGLEPHEFNILKLEDGKAYVDVAAFLTGQVGGPPPFAPVGGANGIDAGVTEYAELDLVPGTYVAICNIPSPKADGHPHFTLGMIKQFTVGSTASASFPVGKFIKEGETDYGLMVNADGTFSVFGGNSTYVQGTYEVDGNIFMETSNDAGCETNVSFTYTFDGENLTFQYAGDPVDDATCSGRQADFNDITYLLDGN